MSIQILRHFNLRQIQNGTTAAANKVDMGFHNGIDCATPHSLSIERSGTLMNTLICEKGRRHTSVYSSPMIPMPLEACTYTRRCDTDLDEEGGIIFLDYIIEIRGADVQRTTIRMNIVPLER